MGTRTTEIWMYSGPGWGETMDLTGYKVEALDGSIGKIDRATYETGAGYVHRTKDEIKNAPEFDEDRLDESYRGELGTYYGPGGRGWRERSSR
jgi:hypothetical protein